MIKTYSTSRVSNSSLRQRGSTLIEVLVAMLVLSVGLLGTAGLMVNTMRSVNEQGNFVGAGAFARELGERMMTNRGEALKLTNNPYFFDSASGGWPTSSANCGTTFCSANEQALWDIAEWSKRLRFSGPTGSTGLPSVQAKVCLDSLTATGGVANQWACSPGVNSPVVVKIAWASRDATGAIESGNAAPVSRATYIVSPGALQ